MSSERPPASRVVRSALPVALACVAAFALLAVLAVRGGAFHRFDETVSLAALGLRTPFLTRLMRLLTTLGGWPFVTGATVGGAAVLAVSRRYAEGLFLLLAVAPGAAIQSLFKLGLGIARPPSEWMLVGPPQTSSFPSGHSTASFLLFGAVAFLLVRDDTPSWTRSLELAALCLAIVAVGFSRVYLGVHWTSDVLAAWALGGAWLTACSAALLLAPTVRRSD